MKISTLIIVLFMTAIPSAVVAEENPEIRFLISDRIEKTITLGEMKDRLDYLEIKIHDPNYGKVKSYKAFSLKDILNSAYGEMWRDDKFSDISFRAEDGYEAVASISRLTEDGGFLVFRDTDYEGWEPVGTRQMNPGPFYIVWKKDHQKAVAGYPWPWQLGSVNLMLFRDTYPLAYPEGAEHDSGIYSGFEIFKNRCIRCHAISRQGGSIGPDLNEPMNILEYRSTHMVKEFIRNPSRYRHTHMPDNPDLDENQLQQIVDYLWYIKRRQ